MWRPTPVEAAEVQDALLVRKSMSWKEVAEAVLAGRHAIFIDRYADLLGVRKALNNHFSEEETSSEERALPSVCVASLAAATLAHRMQRARRRDAARRLLVRVADVSSGALALEGAPQLGYLGVLYGPCSPGAAGSAATSFSEGEAETEISAEIAAEAERSDALLLRANDVSALNVAWNFFVNGVRYPFLRHTLHPFFGVYFTPTPVEHFLLLADWLEAHPDTLRVPSARALDLGTGCGVVSFLLREKRPQLNVVASDICPNAVFSVRNEVERWGASGIEVLESDLFDGLAASDTFDAIIFNPPWVPRAPEREDPRGEGDVGGGNDYPPDLFERLFAAAPRFLRPGGRLLLLFSDYAECRGLVESSPLLHFVGRGSEEVAAFSTSPALALRDVTRRPVDSSKRSSHRITRRDKSWALEREHSVELWEFELVNGVDPVPSDSLGA